MNILDQLISTRALLTPKGAWGQGQAAKDEDGLSVPSISENAVCFCLYGALSRVSHNGGERVYGAIPTVQKELLRQGFNSFSQFNDRPGLSQRDVLGFLDGLIRCQIVEDKISAGGNDA